MIGKYKSRTMQICRICLVRDIELHDIEIDGLKTAYETLTNCLLTQDGFPEKLCWECRARLLSCARFRAKALRGQAQLTAVTLFDQCNVQQLEYNDREKHSLSTSLTCKTYINHCDFKLKWIETEEAASRPQPERVKEEWDGESDASETAACSLYVGHEVKSEPVVADMSQPDFNVHKAQYVIKPVEPFDVASDENKVTNKLHDICEVDRPQACTAEPAESGVKTILNVTPDPNTDLNPNNYVWDESVDIKDFEEHSTHNDINEATNTTEKCTYNICNICTVCDYNTKSISSFLEHQKTHKPKPHKCDNCDYKTASRAHLQRHVTAVHMAEKSFKCCRCHYACHKKERLLQHLMLHSGEKPYMCICGYKSIDKKHLKRHIELGRCPLARTQDQVQDPKRAQTVEDSAVHSKSFPIHSDAVSSSTIKTYLDTIFQCDECGKTYHLKSELRKHILTHMLLKESLKVSGYNLSCTSCQITFSTKSLLSKHVKIEHTKLACTQCDFQTVQKWKLIQHQKKHTGDKPYQCDTCDYQAARKNRLEQHIMCKHINKKPYKCNQCESRFNLKSNLHAHKLIHTGEKPYKCRYCSFTSRFRSSLHSHEKWHTGEKPYKCSVCDYRTARKCNVKIHIMNMHTRERPFKCDFCSYTCKGKWHLKQHVAVHTSEKPFYCEICTFRSKRSSDLRKHVKLHHNFQSSAKPLVVENRD